MSKKALAHRRDSPPSVSPTKMGSRLALFIGFLSSVALGFEHGHWDKHRYSRWKEKEQLGGEGGWAAVFVREPVDCLFTGWSSWSACTRPSSSGKALFQVRTRTITTRPMFGGRHCPHMKQARECRGAGGASQRKPQHCDLSRWSSWSSCTKGFHYRKRTVLQLPAFGGQNCPHLKEARECQNSLLAQAQLLVQNALVELHHGWLELLMWLGQSQGSDVALFCAPLLLVLLVTLYVMGNAPAAGRADSKLDELVARRRTSSNTILPRTQSKLGKVPLPARSPGDSNADGGRDSFDPWAMAGGEDVQRPSPRTPPPVRTPPGQAGIRHLLSAGRPALELPTVDDDYEDAPDMAEGSESSLQYTMSALIKLIPSKTPRPAAARPVEGEQVFGIDTATLLIEDANPVGRLTEYTQSKGDRKELEYVESAPSTGSGFICKVLLESFEVGIGFARNKRQAKHLAAIMALRTIRMHPDLSTFTMPKVESVIVPLLPLPRPNSQPADGRGQQLPGRPRSAMGGGDVAPLQVDEKTRWKATVFSGSSSAPSDADKVSLRRVNGLLNKLTLDKFDPILAKVIAEVGSTVDELPATDMGRYIGQVAGAFVRKAQADPHFSMMYARLWKEVSSRGARWAGELRENLLERCAAEFRGVPQQVTEGMVDWAKQSKGAQEERSTWAKKCVVGHAKLVGCLHLNGLVTEGDIFGHLAGLKARAKEEDGPAPPLPWMPCAVERLCVLLQTVGKHIHQHGDNAKLHKLVDSLRPLSITDQSRIRFMVQGMFELRTLRWEPRRMEEQPSTLAEVHEKAAVEAQRSTTPRRKATTPRRERFDSFDKKTPRGGGGGGRTFDWDTRAGTRGTAPTTPGRTCKTPTKRTALDRSSSFDAVFGREAPARSRDLPAAITPTALTTKCVTLLRDSGASTDVTDVCERIAELMVNTPAFRERFAVELFDLLLQRTEAGRVQLMQVLAKLHEMRELTASEIVHGLVEILANLDDLAIDVPRVRDYVAEAIAHLKRTGSIDTAALPQEHRALWE